MASKIFLLVIFSLVSRSIQDLNNNEIDIESNPYKEAADEIRKEQNAQNLGAIFQNVLENEGENIVGNILSQFGKENAGQLLQGLGSILSQNNKKDSDTPNILESIGTIMSNMQGDSNNENQGEGAANLLQGLGSLMGQGDQGNQAANLLQGLSSLLNQGGQANQEQGGGAADLLQGLGSLLGQADDQKAGRNQDQGEGVAALLQGLGSLMGQGGQGGINPAMIGTMLNLFANQGQEKEAPDVRRTLPSKRSKESRNIDTKPQINEDFNMDDIMALAGNFLGSGDQKGKKPKDINFLSLLPSILKSINAFIGPEADKRAKGHEGHSWLMPPLLEKFHIFFDHFIHSDIGKQTIAALGAEKSFKIFFDEKGRFSYKKFGEMMENHSYRRQWIRLVTDRIASFLQYASEPKVYKTYITGGQLFFNTYFKGQGFPKAAMFDPSRPVETISAFVNYAAKKYFEIKINSKEYVKPAVMYIMDVLRLAEKSGTMKSLGNSKELSNKLADTINLEIIEPLARVNRAFRFSKAVPKCARYVLCLVNENQENEAESLPGLKKLLYKGSSLLAGWFLSAETSTPFWTLYMDITDKSDCKKLYKDECNAFHVEELRVTTEYVHNEL